MRILLLTHHYAPETRPSALRWFGLAREFADAGHQLDVIAPHPRQPNGRLVPGYEPTGTDDAPERGPNGESIYRVRFRQTEGTLGGDMRDQVTVALSTVAALLRLRRRLNPDVIVATAPALPTLAAGFAAKLVLRRPLIMELRDAWPDLVALSDRWEATSQRPSLRTRIALSVAPPVLTWLQRRADHVVTTTTTFAHILRRRGLKRVSVIRNSPHALEDYSQHTPRVPDGSLRIVYVGTVGRAQGLLTAVEALRMVRDHGVDAELRIIGTGAGISALTARTAEEDLPIVVQGAQPRSTIHEHYAWADTFLVMLRDWQPFEWSVPSKLFEAMSLGMHVSGSVSGEAAEIIRETGCGFVVPPEDPEALAAEWIALAGALPAHVDRQRSLAWLAENASEQVAARRYGELLADIVPGSMEIQSRTGSHR